MNQPIEAEVPDEDPADKLSRLFDDARKAYKAFQRADQIYNWVMDLTEEETDSRREKMPVMEITLRGPDGDPMTVSYDSAEWSSKDQDRLLNLLKRNSVTDYGPILEAMKKSSAEAAYEYAEQTRRANTATAEAPTPS